jgi:hypothetical protein
MLKSAEAFPRTGINFKKLFLWQLFQKARPNDQKHEMIELSGTVVIQ